MRVARSTSQLIFIILCVLIIPALGEAPFRFMSGVRTPMRDGVTLVSDIWLPKQPGTYPTILVRTPYIRTSGIGDLEYGKLAEFFVQHQYAFVVQDVRGRGDSEGQFHFAFNEGLDGYDSVEWLAVQPWSNGRIGMMGVSYLGTTQWLAARERPPHLLCIAPASPGNRDMDPYEGGALWLKWALSWTHLTSGKLMESTGGLDLDDILKKRPLLTLDEELGPPIPLYREFLQHDRMDQYWSKIHFSVEDFRKIDIPSLTITGWFDGLAASAVYYWQNMTAYSPAREHQYLIIGPWTHIQTFTGGQLKLGAFEFSPESILDLKSVHLAFFDTFLKGESKEFNSPRTRVYLTGINQWYSNDQYPPRSVQHRRLFLHSGGHANTLRGDGGLSWETPRLEPTDQYTYFPNNPVPSPDDDEYGVDQRYLERRDDVLVYTSDTLNKTIEVLGQAVVHLVIASDALDTDFTARILDVYPDGRAFAIGSGIGVVRARYRNQTARSELLIPGHREAYQIDLHEIGHAFLPGHKLRLELSSSYAPAIHPNPNTGNPISTDTSSRPATQTIFHQLDHQSYIALPVR